jgi:apolipoprotein N-acyltransferase
VHANKIHNIRLLALCALGGVLYFLTFLSFDLFPLTWICFVPVLWATREASARQSLLLGWLFGFVTNAGGFYWVVHLITEFGRIHVTLAVLGFALLCAYQGLLVALVVMLVRQARVRLGIAPVWSLPVAIVALELVYPLLFPSYIGNSQFKFTALTQIVDVTGVLGLSALIGFLNGAAYELLEALVTRRRIVLARVHVVVSLVALTIVYGVIRLPKVDAITASADTIKVGIVQTNLGARYKDEAPAAFMREHITMSKALVAQHPEVELLIWPESVYHGFLRKGTRRRSRALAAIGTPILMGTLTIDDVNEDGRAEYFNSLALISSAGEMADVYDKVELVAFGETLPLARTIPAIGEIIGGGNWFTHGSSFEHLRLNGATFLPTVCYEDIIPPVVRRIWREDGPADVLVNITNDSWYGDTAEPMIHLVLATFRSIETRRALVRSTNTGISAIVDPAGRIVQRTGQWTRETMVANVPLIKTGSTTLYMRIGDVIGYLAVVLVAWGLVVSRRRKAVTSD